MRAGEVTPLLGPDGTLPGTNTKRRPASHIGTPSQHLQSGSKTEANRRVSSSTKAVSDKTLPLQSVLTGDAVFHPSARRSTFIALPQQKQQKTQEGINLCVPFVFCFASFFSPLLQVHSINYLRMAKGDFK